jgi:hypothetical protein
LLGRIFSRGVDLEIKASSAAAAGADGGGVDAPGAGGAGGAGYVCITTWCGVNLR